MERWSGRVALVTGASAGIGAAIVRELVKNGLIVVGLARRAELVEELSAELKGAPGKLHALKGDVSKEEDILAAFDWVKKNLGRIDVLVNNAGVLYLSMLTDGETSHWKQIFDLNVLGLSICTREAFKLMKEKGVDDGHIIHINSIDGHMPVKFPGMAHYFASKHAVTVLTEGLRRELVQLGSKIRVTSISPGVVDTDMFRSFTDGVQVSEDEFPALKSEDIANAVTYALGTPPHIQGDASKEEDILAAFDWIRKNLGRIDVLVNNAAILHMLSLMDENTSQWKQMFDLNVLGLSICTREALKLMKEKGVDDGHIIHINGVLGHTLGNLPGLIPYVTTKYAVTVLTEGLRRELVQLGSKIRVTRWSGRVALVTGASVGIGAAIVRELVKNGLIVVGLARRAELVEELSAELKGAPGKLHALKGDLTKEEDILAAFDWVKKNLGRIDVLVNNAGVLHLSMLTGGETSHWKQIFDLNVLGLSISTREAFKLMKEKGVDDGHIIHINSISPGGVDTDMVKSVTGQGPIPEGEFPLLQAEDIANAVTYVLSTPPHVQRWSGRVALVTGASVGIGAAIVRELVKNGLIVVGLARRAELVELKGAPGKLHALKGDVSKEEDILAAFDWIKKNLGRIDVLVNNAAVLHISMLTDSLLFFLLCFYKRTEGETSHWKQIFDLNVLGLSICTREAFKLMKEKGVDDGHIIHINSQFLHDRQEAALAHHNS
uniref:Uncharacterized protein n=1 Tax=Timema genevievae TaxID=629358 RepID=A0A7R9JNY8_TIMGE|nr:unnamed protein product [Timema genevievae]